ncbi:MAG: hypothetical protein RL375_862 [Pseudomonadota bacterium]|jgi:hypothetical protein
MSRAILAVTSALAAATAAAASAADPTDQAGKALAESPNAAPAAPATADYLVVSPLDHDGTRYAPGSTIALTERQAAPLLGHTVTAVPAPQPAEPAGGEGETDPPPDA